MPRACTDPSCSGQFIDGFCDTCGRAEPAAGTVTLSASPASTSSRTGASHTARQGGYARTTGRLTAARRPTATGATAGTAPGTTLGTGSTRTRSTRGSSSRRRALGGGLVAMPVEPSADPLQLLLPDPRIPPGKAVCPACGNRVNPDKRFCSNCGAEYDFKPSLKPGDVLADQYEVKGPIAFGGLGWIYLAMDTRLNRWVVLKGLLNSRDPAAAAAAVAERQFLAAVKHGKIVGIYTFVTRPAPGGGGESFIVMEYVGGRTLKAIRRERGPLPPAEAMAYIIGILPAFAYLHEQGLVYCDFKPDNVMLEADDVKLIDLGAVRRVGDPSGDIYGTTGYKAPEADDDPIPVSDLYTIGRTLAVLLMDFDNLGRDKTTLPPPNDLLQLVPEATVRSAGLDPAQPLRATGPGGTPLPPWLRWNAAARTLSGSAPPGTVATDLLLIPDGAPAGSSTTAPARTSAAIPLQANLPLAANESLYRFLLKATAADPDARFQSADEMAAQLTGVLRETVARDTPVPAADSAVFLPERPAPGDPTRLDAAWRRLPDLRLDPEDPAAAELFAASTAEPEARQTLLSAAAKSHPQSAEALLRLADLVVGAGNAPVDRVMALLDKAFAIDPFDWRPDWYAGKLYLSLGRAAEAIECLDKVYGEIPGESVPKLALALALEADNRTAEAAGLYDTVSRTDPALAAAAFGLARCRLAATDREGAVAALARVPDSAAQAAAARLAAVRALSGGEGTVAPTATDLRRASDILSGLDRDDIPRHEAVAAVALQAARQIEAGALKPNGATLFGLPVSSRTMRTRAEAALRACARLSENTRTRIAYIDQANAVRPRTLL